MRPRLLETGISLGLILLTVVAFRDVVWGDEYEFVNFDDYAYVRDNPHVQAGLTPKGLGWALTSFTALNWHPLTWVSFQLDSQIYGTQPRGFHLTNLLLLLDYWPLRRWLGSPPEPAGGADATAGAQAGPPVPRFPARRLVLEKVPLLLAAAGCALLTIRAQGTLIETAQTNLPLGVRV